MSALMPPVPASQTCIAWSPLTVATQIPLSAYSLMYIAGYGLMCRDRCTSLPTSHACHSMAMWADPPAGAEPREVTSSGRNLSRPFPFLNEVQVSTSALISSPGTLHVCSYLALHINLYADTRQPSQWLIGGWVVRVRKSNR
jgi:hypothetical protein